MSPRLIVATVAALWLVAATALAETPLQAQNELLFHQLETVHNLTPQQMQAIRNIFARSGYVGQGNPAVTPGRARRLAPRPASTSSSSPTSRAPIRWSG